jgi:predicted phosphodiesterase
MTNKTIEFNVSRPLKLIQFTDLHLSLRYGQKFRRLTEKLVSDAIRDEKPDMAVVTGDLVWSPKSEQIYADFCAYMDSVGLPWAFCFGNHDRDYVKKPAVLEKILMNSERCLYLPGDPAVSGNGNYTVTVADKNGEPKYVFYFFDNSPARKYGGLKGLACGDFSQVDWFRRTAREFESLYDSYHSYVFCHIPLPEYRIVGESGDFIGTRLAPEGPALVNCGLFCALCEDRTVKAVFCGHDHGNDYSGRLDRIALCYGKTTGFNQDAKGGRGKVSPCGARVIILNPDGSFSSYFYMEDNRRYGEDGGVIG